MGRKQHYLHLFCYIHRFEDSFSFCGLLNLGTVFGAGWGSELSKISWGSFSFYICGVDISQIVFILFQMLKWIVTCLFGFLDIRVLMVTTSAMSISILINLHRYLLTQGCGFLDETGITFSIVC